MQNSDLTKLKYPIGEFSLPLSVSATDLRQYMNNISIFPQKLIAATGFLNDEQLDTPYRAGGWTIRQVVHHLADSHMNAYMRVKFAYTEDNPVIKTYFEDRWAETADAKKLPIDVSLNILTSVHKRWSFFLESLTENDFLKTLYHPEFKKNITISEVLSLYSWHCAHHLAHITTLTKSRSWN